MAEKQMNAVLRLRRDSENNFKRTNMILQLGELALVQTPFDGMLVKIGDGVHRFTQLNYESFGILVKGFLHDDHSRAGFVLTDNETPVTPENHLLFLDLNTAFLYYWDGDEYKYIGGQDVVLATDQVAGISKLYNSVNGQNTDGSVTQKAVHDALNKVQTAATNVIYQMDSVDGEQLNADFSSLQGINLFD